MKRNDIMAWIGILLILRALPICAVAIFQAKIPHVVIGASRGDLGFLRPREIDIQVLADDSGYEIKIVRDVLKQDVVELFARHTSYSIAQPAPL